MRTRTSMSVLSPTHEVDAAALAMGRAIEACRHYAHSHTRAHPHKHTRTHTHTHTHPCTQTHALRSTSTRAPTRTCRRMDKRAHTTQMHDHTSTIMHTHVAEPQSQQGQWSVTPSMLRRLYVAKGINARRAARTSAETLRGHASLQLCRYRALPALQCNAPMASAALKLRVQAEWLCIRPTRL